MTRNNAHSSWASKPDSVQVVAENTLQAYSFITGDITESRYSVYVDTRAAAIRSKGDMLSCTHCTLSNVILYQYKMTFD